MSGISSINQARPGSELAAGICYHPLSLSHGTLICSDPEPWNVLTVSLQHTLQRENWEDDQPEGEEGSRESLDLPRRSVALGSLRLFPGAPSGPARQRPLVASPAAVQQASPAAWPQGVGPHCHRDTVFARATFEERPVRV